jgi:hypothetical protein
MKSVHHKGFDIQGTTEGAAVVVIVTRAGERVGPFYRVDLSTAADIQHYTGKSGLDHLIDAVKADIDAGIIA